MLYLASLVATTAVTSLWCHLTAIRLAHVVKRLEDRTKDVRVDYLLRSIQRAQARIPIAKAQIKLIILRNIRATLNLHTPQDTTFWAVCFFLFYSFLRRSNVLSINFRRIKEKLIRRQQIMLRKEFVQVIVTNTKTRQSSSQPRIIWIPSNPQLEMCLMKAMQQCWTLTAGRTISQDSVFYNSPKQPLLHGESFLAYA